MNKKTSRLILNLIFVIIFLLSCIGILSSLFVGAWLHTYKVFTQKTLVAEIEVSALRNVDGKKEFDVTYRPIKTQSALVSLFQSPQSSDVFEEEEQYTFVGDEIRLGGQVIKFNDPLNLLGFKTVYKVTRIESAFLDASQEQEFGRTVYELNGGVDTIFKYFQTNEGAFSLIIDTAMGDYPGKNVQKQKVEYGLYVTEEGFLLDNL